MIRILEIKNFYYQNIKNIYNVILIQIQIYIKLDRIRLSKNRILNIKNHIMRIEKLIFIYISYNYNLKSF